MKRRIATQVLSLMLSAFLIIGITACSSEKEPASTAGSKSSVETSETGSDADTKTNTTDMDDDQSSDDSISNIIVPHSTAKKSTKQTGNTTRTTNNQAVRNDFFSSVPKNLSGKTVKILVWWNPSENEVKKMEYFTQKTGIKVKFIQTTLSKYAQKLSSLISQGSSPDIAKFMDNDYPAVIMKNYFQPLSAGAINLKDKAYDVETMNHYKWKGKYYGLTIKGGSTCDFFIIAYNKTMFKNKGVTTPYDLWKSGKWNWDTLLSTAQAMTNPEAGIYGLTSEYQANYLVQSAGVDPVIVTENRIVNNCSDPKLLKAWQYINDLEDKYKVLSMTLNLSGFCSGKAAMYLCGNFQLQKDGVFATRMTDEWGFAPCPSPAGQKFTAACTSKLWGFPTGSKNTVASSYALRYWLDPNYDLSGYETWYSDEVNDFVNWLWDQPKTPSRFQGIVDYGGNYSWAKMTSQLASTNSSGVKSVLDSWSSVIDANIDKIMAEFG